MKKEQKKRIKSRLIVGTIFLFLLLLVVFVPSKIGGKVAERDFDCVQNRGYTKWQAVDSCTQLEAFGELAGAWLVGLLITSAIVVSIGTLIGGLCGLYVASKKIYLKGCSLIKKYKRVDKK